MREHAHGLALVGLACSFGGVAFSDRMTLIGRVGIRFFAASVASAITRLLNRSMQRLLSYGVVFPR